MPDVFWLWMIFITEHVLWITIKILRSTVFRLRWPQIHFERDGIIIAMGDHHGYSVRYILNWAHKFRRSK